MVRAGTWRSMKPHRKHRKLFPLMIREGRSSKMLSRGRRRQRRKQSSPVNEGASGKVKDLHCHIPEALHFRAKVLAAQQGCSMKFLVTRALERYLSSPT